MDIQLIIVILIGIAVAAISLREVYKFFFISKKKGGCGSCCSGCELSKDWKDKETNPYTSHLKK